MQLLQQILCRVKISLSKYNLTIISCRSMLVAKKPPKNMFYSTAMAQIASPTYVSHDMRKQAMWRVPCEDSDLPSLIRVFPVHSKGSCGSKPPLLCT